MGEEGLVVCRCFRAEGDIRLNSPTVQFGARVTQDDLRFYLNGARKLDEIGRWNLHPRRSSLTS